MAHTGPCPHRRGHRLQLRRHADTLTNGHLGLSYKLRPQAIVYLSAASAADINGGASDVGTNSGYGGAVIYNGQIASTAPERPINCELGTKRDLLHQRLLLTAALFANRVGLPLSNFADRSAQLQLQLTGTYHNLLRRWAGT